MVKQELGETTIEGSLEQVISECGAMLHHIATTVENGTNVSYETVLADVEKARNLYKLIAAGMEPDEAAKVVGLAISKTMPVKDHD